MGAVYKALDERLGRHVALKQLHARLDSPASRERFFREARALASLNHPAIVQIFDLVEEAGQPWIVMELVEGRNLRQVIASRKVLPETAMKIGRQIASGLAVAHETGIVHRDLKAGNLILNDAGELKILDFGLATHRSGGSDPSVSVEGRLMGTPAAMSPEQAFGRAVDHRSDLFSLGILLYRLISGRSPFAGHNAVDTIARIRYHHPPSLRELESEVPAPLARLVERLLEKSPADRPQSASEVYSALGRLLGIEEQEALPPILLAADRPGSGDQTLTEVAHDAQTVVSGASLLATEERRLLTVLACELSGAGGDALDPEDLAEAMQDLVPLLESSVERYEGEVGEARGSRVTAVFGHPLAHEDDPLRAILAARDLLRELDGSSQGADRFAVRIGIHTGLAIAAQAQPDGGGLMLGQTLDLADDLGRAAEEGTILVSPTTRATAGGQAVFEAVVLANGQMAFRVETVREEGAAELERRQGEVFVSRQQELRLMMDRWQLVQEGEGQVLLITGEAGIGKSSLVGALRRRLGTEAVQWVQAAGSAYHTDSPLRPVRQILGAIADSEEVSSTEPLARLKALVERAGLESRRALPHLAHLLQLPLDEEMESQLPIDLETRRRGSLMAVVELLLGLAQAKERVLVIDDLQWVDASTLELLMALTEAVASVSLLLVLTARSGFSVPWASQSRVNQLSLRKLTERESAELLDRLLGERTLPPEVRRRIVENTDGVPLFIEEMTKSVLERMEAGASSRTGSATDLEIPLTLRGTLTARLDRLGTAKEIAQIAAAQGREFDYDVVAELAGLPDAELRARIDSLVKSGLILRSRKGAGSFLFKHALIRDAAYDSLLRAQRRRVHGLIADALAKLRPQLGEQEPELVAHHLQQAGRYEEALELWRSAAGRAMSRSAMVEGGGYVARALECLEQLPDSSEKTRKQLELVNAEGWVRSFTGGIVSQEVRDSRLKAVELSRELNETETTFQAVGALFGWYYFNMEEEPCDDCVRQLADLAEQSDNPEYPWLVGVYRALIDYHRGELEAVIEACRPGLERWEQLPERPLDPTLLSIWEEAVLSLLASAPRLTSRSLWHLGYPERAIALKGESLERSTARSHLLALNDFAEIELYRGNYAEALRLGELSVELAEEISPDAVATPYAQLGAALIAVGENERGCGLLAKGVDAMRATGEAWIKARILRFFVDAQLQLGEIDRGLEAVEEPLELSKTTLDSLHEPELLRLKGELLVRRDAADEAGVFFRRAIERAREQNARSWELRASTSLARVLKAGGGAAEAVEALEPVYSWFTEGFETLDLKTARSLLEELGCTVTRP